MDTAERIMRCEIEGSWTARDMAGAFQAFNDLYNTRLMLQFVAEDSREMEEYWYEMRSIPPLRRRLGRRMHPLMLDPLFAGYSQVFSDLSRLNQLIYPQEELRVRRVEYASPGFQDLAGFGEIVGHLKDCVFKIVDIFGSRRRRQLENEEREINNQIKRIQVARDYVALAKECGFEEAELRSLVHAVNERQDPLIKLAESGKLQEVRMLEHNNREDG